MIIQHNISALNSHRQLGINNNHTAKNLEKLSSGYKINRAGDDAAGLAISEKMRGQIRGLAMAEQNASNGISLIQTAEGGLNETHAILQRMRELANQSANGTYKDEVDRENLDKEIGHLKEEIDRIATSTHYNGIKLLDGSLAGGSKAAVAKFDIPVGIAKGTLSDVFDATAGEFTTGALTAGAADAAIDSKLTVTYTDAAGKSQAVSVDIKLDGVTGTTHDVTAVGNAAIKALKDTEIGQSFDVTLDTDSKLVFTAKEAGFTNAPTITSISEVNTAGTTSSTVATKTANTGTDAYQNLKLSEFDAADASKNSFNINGVKFQIVATADDVANLDKGVVGLVGDPAVDANRTTMISQIKQATGLDVEAGANGDGIIKVNGRTTAGGGGGGLTFQIGANGSEDQRVTLSVDNMSSTAIGIDKISVASQESAKNAIEVIDNAINTVSGTRADLGALQNRLEHTLNNLGVTKENLTAAEASIRDVDMAKEMMEFTKNNILVQASQAMLAQANQLPQGVLQLLR